MQGERQPVADRAEVYLRSLLPDGYSRQQATTLQRIAELVEDGVLAERRVRLCGAQIPASVHATRTEVGERLVARLAAFQEWARRNDCSLAPAMEFRTVDDALAGTRYRAVRPPAILLAEYRDGALRCVTPHRDGDGVRSVADRLAELAAGDPTAFEPVPLAEAPAPPTDDDPERAPLPQR